MSKLSKKKIAITGTIGSGKSSVTKIIKEQYKTISADDIVKDLYNEKILINQINKKILQKNNDFIDKEELAKVIFNDDLMKEKLESIVHPLVRNTISNWLEKNNGLLFVEVPLLYEAKFDDLFDLVIVVVTDEKKIVKRLMKDRGYSEVETLSRINHQLETKEKIKKADYLIYNNESFSQLILNVKDVLKKIEVGE